MTFYRRPNLATIRAELYKKYGGACAYCGESDIGLELAQIVPLFAGGTDDVGNFILLCPNCHARMDSHQPREVDLVEYLASLLRLHPAFKDVDSMHSVRQDFITDISVRRRSDEGWDELSIECKSYSAFSAARLSATLASVREYRKYIGDKQFVLAFPGRVPEEHQALISNNNVELWDIDYIAHMFAEQIEQVEHPHFQQLFLSVSPREKEGRLKQLRDSLRACPPGKEHWSRYQALVANVFETLFCPPLQPPISESSDIARVNRRDVILPNYAPDGFWRFMRDSYGADYIVVDAKNYSGSVKKQDALQIANYLKPHGAGLFGLIVCRTDCDPGCVHTLREMWMAYRKMILVLNDADVESMMLAKSSGGNPEDVIRQRIEDFRLSM